MRYTNRFLSARRTLAVAAAGALTLTLFPGMASADLHEDVCADQTEDQFPDDDGGFWEDEINCIAGYGIVSGFADGEYKPGRNVTRAEMAKYMAETYEVATGTEITTETDYFTDDDGHPLEASINEAAEIGVVEGTGGGIYNPQRHVPRSEMAGYVSRMIEAVTGEDIAEDGTDHFTDDEASFFENEINELATIGVVKGTSPDTDTYEPTLLVFRGEMAGFTARAAGYLDAQGAWAPTTPAADVTVAAQSGTVTAGEDVVLEFTGDTTEVASVDVAGACIEDVTGETLTAEDTVSVATSGDFSGECELTVTTTFTDGSTDTDTVTVTVEPAPTGPTITNAELATDTLIFGGADASDSWELQFSEEMATDVFEESTATDVVFELQDGDGDVFQVICNDGGPTPTDDGMTAANCMLGDGDDATVSNDHVVITLLEPAEDRNAAGDGTAEYPLTITATENLVGSADGADVDLAASADVVVDDES